MDARLHRLRQLGDGDTYARLVLAVRGRHPAWTASDRVASFSTALKLGSDPVVRDTLRVLLADQHSLVGDRAEASRCIEGIDPARLSARACNAHALVLRRIRRFEEAEAAWLALTARGDEVPPGLMRYAWSHLAHLRMTTGRLDEVQVALDAAQAVEGADAHESTLHLLSTRFDFALRLRDLDAAQAALDAVPAVTEPEEVEAVRTNQACVAVLRGEFDAAFFRQTLSSARADVRLVAATGLMGATRDRGGGPGGAAGRGARPRGRAGGGARHRLARRGRRRRVGGLGPSALGRGQGAALGLLGPPGPRPAPGPAAPGGAGRRRGGAGRPLPARRGLARWVVEQARTSGSAARVTVHHDPETPVVATPGELVVVTATDWGEEGRVRLGPLDDDALRALLDRSLRLTDELAERLVAEAQGSPGRLLGMLRQLVALDRVVAGPRGMHLRPLARLPD